MAGDGRAKEGFRPASGEQMPSSTRMSLGRRVSATYEWRVMVENSFQRSSDQGGYGKKVRRHYISRVFVIAAALAVGSVALVPSVTYGAATGHGGPFLSRFKTVTNVSSTVPANGDLNPYGIVNVPRTEGSLVEGDTLVSNFNAASNLQGTGTTIVQISPSGQQSLFAQLSGSLPGKCPGGVGLTTALTILHGGFVVVGSLPVTQAGMGMPKAGCLIVLNDVGVPVETWSGPNINGPWDMTAVQVPGFTELFVTNVLNGTVAAKGSEVDQGTVVRLDVADQSGKAPALVGSRVIGTGFAEQLNSAALVLGPTGVALARNGTLYVADTINNRLASIPSAWRRNTAVGYGGMTVTSGGSLSNPLGLTVAPNGDLISVNGGNGNAVETTPTGKQVATVKIDPAGAGGDLFGLTIAPGGRGVLFVDDGDNTLKLFH
jgi:hypothetical protein